MTRRDQNHLWPVDHIEGVENYGHSLTSASYVFRPSNQDQIYELIAGARQSGYSICPRGAGRSYGDASLNSGELVLDFQRMNRILDWNPETGVIRMEPGVSIGQLWKYVIGDGWWPPVVPGTMFPIIAGCLAMNVHGKNNWQAGTIGEHVLSFTAILPNGEEVSCSPEENKRLFYAMIGGLGVLGIFTSVTMQMKKIYSGDLWVEAWATPNLAESLQDLDERKESNDYIVAWIDSTARAKGLGRGQLHSADYLSPGEDTQPGQTLRIGYQTLPDNFFGVIPKSILWRFMRPFMNNLGAWGVNMAKFWSSQTISNHKRYRQSHVAFNFLLDYVPNWELSYGRGGLIQFQSFLPENTAGDAFAEILRLSQKRRMPSYLCVLKRHRPDPFLLTHSVDGFSLAMDFKVSERNRTGLNNLCQEFNQIVLDAGGRFYFAKDSTLTRDVVAQFLGDKTLTEFGRLKKECDPDGILRSDLYRRCFES